MSQLTGVYYNKFIDSINSSATRKCYNGEIKLYLKYLNLEQPDDLLTTKDPQIIESQISRYLVDLRKRNLSYAIKAVYMSAIISFYEMNYVTLSRKRIRKYLGEMKTMHKDRAYSYEEIQKMLGVSDLRTKTIIYIYASTGMRLNALTDIRLSDLEFVEEYKLFQITVYQGTPYEYFTFCTPEAAASIKEYLDYRERCGEQLKGDSILIREQFDPHDLFVNRPRKISKHNFRDLISRKAVESGIRTVETDTETKRTIAVERKEVRITNGFRKFVITNMIRAKLTREAREILVGHKQQQGLDVNYYRPQQGEILQEYLKAVDLLTINEENRLKKKLETATIQLDKFSLLQDKIDRLEKKLEG